jgi:8-oxo-dGTP pyrophosphatase MutT (NUDIX family)
VTGFRAGPERVVHRGPVISLSIGRFEAPDGTSFEREIVRHPGAVSVVPLLDDDTVVLVRQYRAPLDRELLEIPAGKRDVVGEPPEDTAQRELVEEVGLHAGRLQRLAVFHNSVGFCDEESHVFLGTELRAGSVDLQGVEEQHMTVQHVALSEVPTMIERGELTDAKTVIGLLLTLRHLGR